MSLKKKKILFICIIIVSALLLAEMVRPTPFYINSNQEILFSENQLEKKLDYSLQSLLKNSRNNESHSIQIIVVFRTIPTIRDCISKIMALSSKIQLIREWQIISAAVFRVPIEYIENIASIIEVQKIWIDYEFSLSKFYNTKSDNVQISELNDHSKDIPIMTSNSENNYQFYNGTNVIVALLDTGVDIFHPDLKNSILAFGGVSLVEGDPFPLDFHGHGTFIAGVITGDGICNELYKGVASGADILNIKVLSNLGVGLWSWIISGIEYAIVHGADIICMCFSMPGYTGDPVNLAIAAAVERGLVVVTAVGDDGPAYSSVSTPGLAQSAITVGAYNDFIQQPASFSGRGSTISFYTKPDILASGVNIVSCRPSIPSNLPINITELFQGTYGYGLPIDGNYSIVNGTDAAAANVTGLIATLIQHSKFLTAEEIKIILQNTAIPIPRYGPNVQGAGLINIAEAHSYLVQSNLNDSLIEKRLYTPSLISPGYAYSQNSLRNLTLFVSNYGSLLAILESDKNYSLTHIIQGQFAVRYNNQTKWLSDMYVLRELHNLTADFSILEAVFTDYSLIYVFTIETWSSINGSRINLTLINIASTPLNDLSIYSNWNTNLLVDFSQDFSNDTCEYNIADDIIYAYDFKNGNSSYIGFSGMNPSASYELNSSENIRTQIQNGILLNSSPFLTNMSIAMKWFITSQLNTSHYIQLSQCIGLGDSYTTLNNSIQSLKKVPSSLNFTNLAILSSNFSRIGIINQPYTSNILLMNLGNVVINETIAAFLVNSTESQTQTFFSQLINLGRLEPFEFRWVNATWNPTEVDIYSAYWLLGTESLITELVFYLMNISQLITQERNFWDNFYIRNIFVKSTTYQIHDIFPKTIPIAPQLIYYPNDVAIFNLSITTNHPLNNLQVSPLEGNLPLHWYSYSIPSTLRYFGNLQISITIPYDPKPGLYYQKLNITAENCHIGVIWINFSIQYPSGRILFYKPSFNLSLSSTLHTEDLMNLWNERLSTIYSGYFDLFNLCVQNNYDIDDFSILKQFNPNISLDTIISIPFTLPYQTSTLKQNTTFISNYDLVIICDPSINLSQNEIQTLIQFAQDGGSLYFWIEPGIEIETSSINTLLNPFGIEINSSYNIIQDQTFISPNMHEISIGLNKIVLYNFITFQNSSVLTIFTEYNTEPTLLLNNSIGKILCIGDSSLFNDSCISNADNFLFLNNSINWLLKEKINITIIINKENQSEPLRVGEHLSISIHLTSIEGIDVSTNLTLFTFLVTPSNHIIYMIFFHVIDGWYNTLFLAEWLNETGPYSLIIYAKSPSKMTTYAIEDLILEDAIPPSNEDPSIHRNWATNLRILLGVLIALIVTIIILGVLVHQRRRWRRQMTIVELKEKMKREIANLLSEYHLYIKEIEEVLHKTKILDQDKLRMILDKQERSKELLDKLKKLGQVV
ncbi:MAG TPA: S8 family serine peptidase [Candidatus Deferrimicrobium sp.]|nr:S8 family serine peptidase [Candidatus Deferrimicrobium sp.]